MKFKSVDHWINIDKSKSILFFAQLLDELLFDFSLDTYKPSAMNASLLCSEALTTIYNIDLGIIAEPNLTHILREFRDQIEKDDVANDLINIDLNYVYGVFNNKSPIKEIKTVVEIINSQITIVKYKERVELFIVKELCNESSDFTKIRSLARAYITTLISCGYHQKYIHNKVDEFFFDGSNIVSSNDDIKLFLEHFNKDLKPFCVVFTSSLDFQHLFDASSEFKVVVSSNYDQLGVGFNQSIIALGRNEVYICVKDIYAHDIYSARVIAEQKVEILLTIYNLFNHKEELKISPKCVVYDIESETNYLSDKPINEMHKCNDLKPRVASLRLNQFVQNFALTPESLTKFHRVAELHSMALDSRFHENQLINLWVALESIVPANQGEKNITKIEHIIKSVLPMLCVNYMARLMDNLLRDLLRWDRRELTSVVRGVEGSNLLEKLVKIVALDAFEDKRITLKKSFKDYHLLRDRFLFFENLFSKPTNLYSAISNHEKRVSWQLRRIYRARNMVVHSGETPEYTNILIANVHDYVDVIMKIIIELSAKKHVVSTIDQGFMYTNIQYSAFTKWLSKRDAVFSEDDIFSHIVDPLLLR